MHLLDIKHLTKRYGRLTALSDVSFSVRAGEILGLIGPNGSGKTTLFECLGGVLPLDAGAVLHNNRPLLSRQQRSIIFYLPDAIGPWPEQSVRWAIDFAQSFFGGRADLRDEIIRQLDLEAVLDSAIGSLSKGQRKRALLAIGLLTPQPVLLADEPFDGLDLRQSRDAAQTLRSQAAEGRTMVLSIHQIPQAARVCDRFVLLSGGRVCGEGTVEELADFARAASAKANLDQALSDRLDLEEVFLALT